MNNLYCNNSNNNQENFKKSIFITQKKTLNNDDDESINNQISDNNVSLKSRDRRIRKKKFSNRRAFKCEICNKDYFSFPALYTHCLFKHDKRIKIQKALPKDESDNEKIMMTTDSETNNETTNLSVDVDAEYVDGRLSEHYALKLLKLEVENVLVNGSKYDFLDNDRLFFPSHHALYREFEILILNKPEIERRTLNTNSTCDEVLSLYLYETAKKRQSASEFMNCVNYIVLFREKVNDDFKNNEDVYRKINYTEVQNPSDLPLISNSFLTDMYREPSFNNYMKETFELCEWLYDKNYTSLRITQDCSNDYNGNQ